MPIEEELKISKFDKARNVIIIDESPEEWRLWRAFTRVFTHPNDLALRVYALLLERQQKTDSRELVTLINEPRYSVDKALNDLHELGLVSLTHQAHHSIHTRTVDYWSVETPVIGVLRLIPKKYFQKGYPKTTS